MNSFNHIVMNGNEVIKIPTYASYFTVELPFEFPDSYLLYNIINPNGTVLRKGYFKDRYLNISVRLLPSNEVFGLKIWQTSFEQFLIFESHFKVDI